MANGNCAHVRLLLRDLHGSFARFDARQNRFQLRDGGLAFSRVRVLGICTQTTHSEQTCSLDIDDGTGEIQVQIDASKLLFDPQELRAGELVRADGILLLIVWRLLTVAFCIDFQIDCLGVLIELNASSNGRARYVAATHITIVKDRNAESLRMLETLQLYQQVYTAKKSASSKTPAASAATLALVSFPGMSPSSGSANSAGMKRKHSASASLNHSSVGAGQHPKTLIEKPRDQHMSNPPQRITASAIPSAFSPPVPTSVLPAAEYRFNVSASDHEHIEDGVKTLEIRLNVPPYSIIRVNDRILINGRTTATVVAVRKYTQLQSVLQTEALTNLLPAATTTAAGQTQILKASAVAMRHFRQFLSAVEEETHGLVVFELRVGSGEPVAPQKKSPEEWSKLLYEQLAKKRSYGCSMADLQFAFPALPVDQIIEILTNVR